jgi:hypothetical protein
MTRALEAERAELLALADQMQALGYSEFGDCLSFDAYNLILAALRLAAAPLGDVREALWNTDGDAVPRNRSVLVRWPSGEHDICYRNDCEGVCIDTWRYATGPMRGTQAGWPKAWCFIDAALDALVPAGGEGKALRLLDQFERDATIGVGVASLLRSALAPQNAGGERHKPFVPATEDEFNELMDNGHNTGGKTYYRPSESTPAPAKCGCGEFCQDLGVDSGCRYISNPPAPADDEPLSARDHAMIDQAWENHKAALPVATVINDNQPGRTAIIEITIDPPTLPVGTKLYAGPKMVELQPAPADDAAVAWPVPDGWQLVPIKPSYLALDRAKNQFIASTKVLESVWQWMLERAPKPPAYTRPAKAVDVEAILTKIKYAATKDSLTTDERLRSVLALLRDSNASSDKGGR